MSITIRIAHVAGATALSALGAQTFRDTFADSNTPDDMARYLAESFTPEQQAGEIADPSSIVLVAERRADLDDSELVGYAHLVAGETPEAVRGLAPMELKRMYVARARGVQTLWLGVWERNPRAQAFYAK